MIFNRSILYENVGQSDELVVEMVKIYVEDAPAGFNKVKQAIAERNYQNLQDSAHGVKGAAMSINAEDYSEIARKLELVAIERSEDLEPLEKEFDYQYNILMNELNKILE